MDDTKNKLFNGSIVSKSLDDNKFKFIATVEESDRDNDIVYVDGIDMTNFQKNPLFLKNHDYNSEPIGKVTGFEKVVNKDGKKELIIDVDFAETEEGQKYKYFYKNGFMSAVSISFMYKTYDIDSERKGYNIFTSELLEVSAVTVPANSNALLVKAYNMDKTMSDMNLTMEKMQEKINIYNDIINKIVTKLDGEHSNKNSDNNDNKVYDYILKIANKIK